jgi:hypothetical protein
MIVVIQCAGSKRSNAGRLIAASGKPVLFVARPDLAPRSDELLYAKPDDRSDIGKTWRQVLVDYNNQGANPQGLHPAHQLYRDAIYGRLAQHVGLQNLYILSAGWGLIPAEFLTPDYDITFSQVKKVDRYKQRMKTDRYDDFCMLPRGIGDTIVFFGSQRYVPKFCALTESLGCRERVVFHKTAIPPDAPGCVLKMFEGATRDINWQYDCANALLDGAVRIAPNLCHGSRQLSVPGQGEPQKYRLGEAPCRLVDDQIP